MPKFVNLVAFLQKLISKEHVVVIMEFPDWVQVKMKILYIYIYDLLVLTRFGSLISPHVPVGHQSGSALWLQLCNIWAS